MSTGLSHKIRKLMCLFVIEQVPIVLVPPNLARSGDKAAPFIPRLQRKDISSLEGWERGLRRKGGKPTTPRIANKVKGRLAQVRAEGQPGAPDTVLLLLFFMQRHASSWRQVESGLWSNPRASKRAPMDCFLGPLSHLPRQHGKRAWMIGDVA